MSDTNSIRMEPAQHAALRAPFPANQIRSIPRKQNGREVWLDYVGHAEVTNRLLEVDPCWTWEPMALDANGLPMMERTKDGYPIGLWIRLTVCGVTRIGYGSVDTGKSEPEKELIGDAIRNAAMRFGVALDCWAKSDLHNDGGRQSPPSRNGQAEPHKPVSTFEPPRDVDWETGEVRGQPDGEPQDIQAAWTALNTAMRAASPPLRGSDLAPILGGTFNLAAFHAWLGADQSRHIGQLIAEAQERRRAVAGVS